MRSSRPFPIRDGTSMRNAVLDRFSMAFEPRSGSLAGIGGQRVQPSVGAIAGLRKELSAERVHLVLQQAALRHRARDKFAAAERMFFTPLGLEQATDEVIAQHKAQRFAERLGSPRAGGRSLLRNRRRLNGFGRARADGRR